MAIPTPHRSPRTAYLEEKYKRRVVAATQPKLRSRQLQLASWAISLSITGYVVLFADFGPQEHCFSSLRRWFDGKRRQFWSLSAQEQQDLKDQGRLTELQNASASTQRT
ncbi:uncharacterized protein BYT42DRAFT_566695 [Radiomyces spectabilis]|uniref:uncharacterized protein n=1 Tax=Radiomyces spectabilis TaxID=64574 RepID=UPI002220D42B|nr:uncharacterized protein BYT42DRAFT_566695 [Radiomyces spectabilis]KAI8381484.1 hypothetical protein BYT42DRAFT_566695 [Radiomyces spectabilis]